MASEHTPNILTGPIARVGQRAADDELGPYLDVIARILARDANTDRNSALLACRQLMVPRAAGMADSAAADHFGYYLAGVIDGYDAARETQDGE